MKRSKIFLGVTTCLLGLAAFAASKAKWNGVHTAYLTKVQRHVCVPVSQLGTVVVQSSGQLKTLIVATGRATWLYTNAISSVCDNPAYFKPE